jgi:FlaA1/EpsC-like NDP-sugar epimerase
LDVVLALVATWIALTLRLDELNWPTGGQWWVYGLAPLLALPIFVKFGLYRAIFRYSGSAALYATGKAVLVYAILLTALVLWFKWPNVPRSVAILQPLVFLFLVGASRALARFWLASLNKLDQPERGRILIFGAGTSGVQTADALRVSRQFELVGFVDDDLAKIGRSINGIPVFSPSEVPTIVLASGVTDILLAPPGSVAITLLTVCGFCRFISGLCLV